MSNLISVKATRAFGPYTVGDEFLVGANDPEVKRHLANGLLERVPKAPAIPATIAQPEPPAEKPAKPAKPKAAKPKKGK